MKSFSRMGLAVAAVLGLVGASLAACGGGGSGDQGSSHASGGGGSAGTRTGSHGTSTASNNPSGGGTNGSGGFNPVGPTGSGTNAGSGGGPQCGGTSSTAEPIPLDIYIMLDKSGSMSDTTSDGATKWSAVTQALDGFFADPQSMGLDVGIQFFPLNKPGVPDSCTQQSDCPNGSGPCVLKACADGSPNLSICTSNAQCGGAQCVPLGTCPQNPNEYCYPVGHDFGAGCGVCQALTSSFCNAADSCASMQYGTPAVEIGALDTMQINALTAAVAAHAPHGATPTSAALQGATDHAKTWAQANPTHTVVVVFATDGLPTECNPTDIPSIAQIAATAAGGTPSIKTYVIGVLSQADIMNGADTNLQQIAQSGGGQAFIINSSTDDVEAQFVQAMNSIRAAKLACEYLVPPAPDGGTQDYTKVNVDYTPPGGMTETIGYVGSAANCDPSLGGWYYDVDPSSGGTPTKIIMCPATCNELMNGGSIQIRVGCKTKIQPPPH
ncbi:MAG TPA: vWA domain-containing protein [Minicystis sp.]|nr:vWA domain-containing protein [Minicystis sp.]